MWGGWVTSEWPINIILISKKPKQHKWKFLQHKPAQTEHKRLRLFWPCFELGGQLHGGGSGVFLQYVVKLLSWRDLNCLLKWVHYHNIKVYVYSMNTLWDCWSQWILDLWLLVQQIKWIMCKKRNAHLMHNKYASHSVASALLSFSSFTKKQNRSRNLRNVCFVTTPLSIPLKAVV